MFMVLRKRQVLAGLGGLLLAAGILTGVLIRTVQAAAPAASADTNWGLSFQQEGKTPVGNASSEFLSQYEACYAGPSDEKAMPINPVSASSMTNSRAAGASCPESL